MGLIASGPKIWRAAASAVLKDCHGRKPRSGSMTTASSMSMSERQCVESCQGTTQELDTPGKPHRRPAPVQPLAIAVDGCDTLGEPQVRATGRVGTEQGAVLTLDPKPFIEGIANLISFSAKRTGIAGNRDCHHRMSRATSECRGWAAGKKRALSQHSLTSGASQIILPFSYRVRLGSILGTRPGGTETTPSSSLRLRLGYS